MSLPGRRYTAAGLRSRHLGRVEAAEGDLPARRQRWSSDRATERPQGKAGPRNGGLWCARDVSLFPQGGGTFDADSELPVPVFGAYPSGFIAWAARIVGAPRSRILHVCSGSLAPGEGIRIDVRPDARPDILADGRALPLRAGSVEAVLLDPPYTERYSRDLYGTNFPRARPLLEEAARVVRPGGAIGILHFFVPNPPARCELVRVWGITLGCGFRIRAFTLYRREQARLPLGPPRKTRRR